MKNLNKYKVTINLKQAIAFCVLMENNDGIMHKSPQYVLEKLARVEYHDKPEEILDAVNQSKFFAWFKKWVKEDNDVESGPAPTLPSL